VPGRVFGRVLAAAVAAAWLGGCSLGEDEEPEAVSGVPRQVAATIEALEQGSRDRDWAAICDEVFSRTALERAGGRDCERLLREQAQEVRRPEIRVLSIELGRGRAEARVRTSSAGQSPVEETIVLVREDGEWRVDSLAPG
jgi:hypothetical protein